MGIQTALVVDDSPSARYILQRLLERQHIRVHVADSAQQAFAYLRANQPDVVFMDDMMPGMEGQEAVDRLGADPHTANIPIIMYTGRDYASDAPPSSRRGVIGVLSKPFTQADVEALLAKIGTANVRQTRPEPPRLVRMRDMRPAASAGNTPIPITRASSSPESLDMLRAQLTDAVKTEARLAVEQLLGEHLESQVDARIERHTAIWHHALEHVRNEHTRAQSQLLDERLPRLLELLEQRLDDRLERHAAELERDQTPNIGPLQRAQIARLVHAELATAVDRPARQSARRVAAELMRGDLNVLGLRLDRMRRRFNRVVVAAVVAVIAVGIGGYLIGVVGLAG